MRHDRAFSALRVFADAAALAQAALSSCAADGSIPHTGPGAVRPAACFHRHRHYARTALLPGEDAGGAFKRAARHGNGWLG